MAKSKYREKQERGLVPSRYPSSHQMRGAWQHWRNTDNKERAHEGRNDLKRPNNGHTFIEPHNPTFTERDATRSRRP